MKSLPKLLAICGSTRQASSNHQLINAVKTLAEGIFEITDAMPLVNIPHFNPDEDMDPEQAPAPVKAFREQLEAADAVLISTPEYAIGVPGALKNAIDWTVSSMHFSSKPVALITAGTSGYKAHQSLLGTLLIIESRITEATQLVIPAVKTKINSQGIITDELTLNNVRKLVNSLADITAGKEVTLLPSPGLR